MSTVLCFLAVLTLGILQLFEGCSVSLIMDMLSDKLFSGRNLFEVGIIGALGPTKGQPNF
jgi:hypothetical protein